MKDELIERLPEEVARWINLLADFDRAYGKDKRYGELADMLERLARRLDACIKGREKLVALRDEDQQRIAELEWNYEAACSTLEVRDKEIERLDAALEAIKKNLDDGRVMSHGWLTELIRKARAGE